MLGKYHHWTIIKSVVDRNRYGMVLAKCDCGKESIVDYHNIVYGTSKSCCYIDFRDTWKVRHGQSKQGKVTPEYRAWTGMKSRCYNKNRIAYKYYGGRGIKVCDRWKDSFELFLMDMGKKPSDKHSLDRINNDGNYEPSNCRWADSYEQVKNKRGTVMLTYSGKTQCLKDWCREYRIAAQTIRDGLKVFTFEEIMERVIHKKKCEQIIGSGVRLSIYKMNDYKNRGLSDIQNDQRHQ